MKLFKREKQKRPEFLIDVWPGPVVGSEEIRDGVTTTIGKRGWAWVALRTEPYRVDMGEAATKDRALEAAQEAITKLRSEVEA